MTDYIGQYYSREWVRKNILRQSEKEVEELDNQIAAEKESGEGDGDEDEFMADYTPGNGKERRIINS